MSLLIREMEENDIKEACNLMNELTGHPISETDMKNRLELARNSSTDDLYVCVANEKVQGVLGFRVRENLEEASRFGEISVIVTSSGSRRLGIGKAMMEFAEGLAREKECIGTWLVTDLDREEAQQFYQNLGYKINGYRLIKPF